MGERGRVRDAVVGLGVRAAPVAPAERERAPGPVARRRKRLRLQSEAVIEPEPGDRDRLLLVAPGAGPGRIRRGTRWVAAIVVVRPPLDPTAAVVRLDRDHQGGGPVLRGVGVDRDGHEVVDRVDVVERPARIEVQPGRPARVADLVAAREVVRLRRRGDDDGHIVGTDIADPAAGSGQAQGPGPKGSHAVVRRVGGSRARGEGHAREVDPRAGHVA